MAHPNLKESRDGHGEKLRRLTENYGSASGPKNNISGPTNRFKQEGPEDAIGFGADSTKPRGRADKASRKQGITNPVATLKTGGAVAQRAHGGRAGKKKGHGTHVNVIVAPQGGGAPGGAPMPMARPPMPMPPAGAMPPGGPPPGMPPGGPPGMVPKPPGAGMPMAPGAPGGMPPGLMPPRKRGGRVHADEKQDKALIEKTLKSEGLVRSDKHVKEGIREQRADGGRLLGKHNMTAGALSGDGRLQKIGKKPHDAGPPQEV